MIMSDAIFVINNYFTQKRLVSKGIGFSAFQAKPPTIPAFTGQAPIALFPGTKIPLCHMSGIESIGVLVAERSEELISRFPAVYFELINTGGCGVCPCFRYLLFEGIEKVLRKSGFEPLSSDGVIHFASPGSSI